MSTTAPPPEGVEIIGVGSALPDRVLTNTDLEKVMDTSDEWIVQRTGIRERRVHDPETGPHTTELATTALRRALEHAEIPATDLDLIIVATMTPDMPTPAAACMVADNVGAGQIGAFDLNAACSGFVFALNTAHDLVRAGAHRAVGVIGADTVTRFIDYSTFGRGAAILFGDAAGACVVRASDTPGKGLIAQAMHSDASRAKHLFIPCTPRQFFESEFDERKLNRVQMNGQAVFKFAVSTFPKLIEQTLDKAGVQATDVDHYICHQSNARILTAARDRFGLKDEQFHINIDRCGNTVAASVPLILDELTRAGRVEKGQKIMMLGFGAGLTWGSSLWQL
ncbi:MAG: beta-ketoacyl-ACP synthase III [Phycisphaerales bacterium JB059]